MRYSQLVAAAAFLAAVACADPLTSPAPTPDMRASLATTGSGNPKFSAKDTDCSSSSTSISCTYKITGLGNTDVVDVFLTAVVSVSGQCRNHGGQIVEVKDWRTTASGQQLSLRPENGQINGTITLSAGAASSPSASQVCPNGQWTLTNVSKVFVGGIDLYAIVHHQDGSTERVDSEF
jgi:hypothetical protein